MVDSLLRVVHDLENYLQVTETCIPFSRSHFSSKLKTIQEKVETIYPKGSLASWEPVQCLFRPPYASLNPKTTSLWFSGKRFNQSKNISDRLGNNDKTKAFVTLAPTLEGGEFHNPPSHQKYLTKNALENKYKKQQKIKRLAKDDDNSYLDSPWADKYEMKRSIYCLNDIPLPKKVTIYNDV